MISKFHQRVYLQSLRSFFKNIVKNYDSFISPRLEDLSSESLADFQIEGSAPAHSFLFSTSSGIYVYLHKDSYIKKLLDGKYYGITKYQDYWIFGRSNNKGSKSDRVSNILAVKIKEANIIYYKVLVKSIPGEIHQIDVFNNRLCLPHTGYNQVLSFDIDKLFTASRPRTILSCSTMTFDIFKPSHLNSVFYDISKGKTYFIAHNSTAHTGRPSDILVLDSRGELTVIHTDSHSAHNIFIRDGAVTYCDSNKFQLISNDKIVFQCSMLLRGLSVTDDAIYVGGSDVCFNSDRNTSNSCIYILNKNWCRIGKVLLPGIGNLYEIRRLTGFDYAMSSCYFENGGIKPHAL